MIKQVVILVDHRDVLQPVGIAVKVGGGLAVQCDRTAGGNVQPGQQREEGRLSAAGRADHGIDLTRFKDAAHAVDRTDKLQFRAVFVAHVPCFQTFHG